MLETGSFHFFNSQPSSILLELSGGLEPDKTVQGTTAGEPPDVNTVRDQAAGILPLGVVRLGERSEAKLAADVNLLTTRELELRTAQSLGRDLDLLLLGPDGDQNLPDLDTRRGAVGLTVSSTHARRQAIRTAH